MPFSPRSTRERSLGSRFAKILEPPLEFSTGHELFPRMLYVMSEGFIALEEECVEEEHIVGLIRRMKGRESKRY